MIEGAELGPVRRGHVADDVFEQLAAAILSGEIAKDSALPPERVLAERFGVSRSVVRSAVHRLAEIGLVRVRQGGATIVLDPDKATDLRVLALVYKLAPESPGAAEKADAADMIEKQYLQGLSIVHVASRRARRAELAAVAEIVESSGREAESPAAFAKFEQRYWRALADAAKNRIFRMEIAFWYDALSHRHLPPVVARTPLDVRLQFYRELTRRLVADDSPVEYYLAAVAPILATLSPLKKRSR